MLRIAEARYMRGWTQEQLAEAIGTTQATIQRWECGQVVPQVSRVEDISRAMGVTLSFLLGLDTESRSIDLSKDEEELLGIMRGVTAEGQKQLMIYARGVAASYPKGDPVRKLA